MIQGFPKAGDHEHLLGRTSVGPRAEEHSLGSSPSSRLGELHEALGLQCHHRCVEGEVCWGRVVPVGGGDKTASLRGCRGHQGPLCLEDAPCTPYPSPVRVGGQRFRLFVDTLFSCAWCVWGASCVPGGALWVSGSQLVPGGGAGAGFHTGENLQGLCGGGSRAE